MGHQTYAQRPTGVHSQFDPGPLDGPKARVLARVDQFLAQATEWEATLLNLRDKLTKNLNDHIASLGYDVPDAFYKQQQASLEEALDQLNKGVPFNAGVIPAIAKIAGKPGLDATQRSVAALRKLRDDYVSSQAVDPNQTAVYRLTKGKHVHEGRQLRPGDTATLSLRQFEAFRDKFEPVAAPLSASHPKAATPRRRHTTEVVMEQRAKRRPN